MAVTATAPPVVGEAPSRAAQVERPAPSSQRAHADRAVPDIVDVWGRDSFPASDAPANW
jgi:hypothetical protein